MGKHSQGRIEVICGCMFSGKTEELIRRLRRAEIAKQKLQVFKPAIDNRYHEEKVMSHNGLAYTAVPVANSDDIMARVADETTVVGIDEVQFFDEGVVDVCEKLAKGGRRVICAGLDMDFRGEPFGPIPYLMARAEEVMKLSAICVISGEPATRTQRLINGEPAAYDDPIVLVGASENYEARSRKHHAVLPPRNQGT